MLPFGGALMRIGERGFLPALVSACLMATGTFGASYCSAQEPPRDTAQPSSPASPSDNNRHAKKNLRGELSNIDRTWLMEEVPYIISDDERRAFLELGTAEEREQFIEMFWRNRNPDPEAPVNPVREEHYRRLAYADEHFASGVPGRKTDRGRIYIIWGPPDEIEAHPSGGTFDRPLEQGGGSTSTYPWEMWRYRHLEGIGENIEIEFVDPSGSGEYRITSDPCEKDALAHVPGAGASLGEILGRSSRADRVSNSGGTTCPMPLGGASASSDEFDRLDRYFRVQHAPARFKELEPLVSARIAQNQIHIEYRADFLRVTSGTVLVPITVQLPNRDLSFQSKEGVYSAKLNLYGRISTPGGVMVQTFEDVISRDVPESLLQSSLKLFSIYQKSVPLRSGLYRLDLVIKDTVSGNLGVFNTALRVPRFEDDKMDASSIILADQIEAVPTREIGTGQFVLNSYKVRPRLSKQFSSSDKLGIFVQLYNLKVDDTLHKTDVSVTYRILKDQQEMWRGVESADHVHQGGEQLTIQRYLPVDTLAAGKYTVEVIAIDLLSNETIIRTADFTLVPAAPKHKESGGTPQS
jgi:GWxTD domain-containing protein